MPSLACSLADQRFATTKSLGIFNFSVGLVRELARRPEIGRLHVFGNRTLAPVLHLPAHVLARDYDSAIRGPIGRLYWDQVGSYRAARAARVDWLLLPKGFASFVLDCPVRLAVYVHDLVFDYYRTHYPVTERVTWEGAYFRRGFTAALRRAHVILTNTDFSKSEIERWAGAEGIAAPPVVRVGYGFEPEPVDEAARPERILVFVSPFPHKRSDIALGFLETWRQKTGFRGELLGVGASPEETTLRPPAAASWRWLGRRPAAEVRALMRQSRVVVYASDYEGFGMPPVEATLVGACAVYSRIPAVREVMGEAGFSFSNTDYDSFGAAMAQALAVPGAQRRAWASMLAARHSWSAVGARVVAALDASGAPVRPGADGPGAP